MLELLGYVGCLMLAVKAFEMFATISGDQDTAKIAIGLGVVVALGSAVVMAYLIHENASEVRRQADQITSQVNLPYFNPDGAKPVEQQASEAAAAATSAEQAASEAEKAAAEALKKP